MKIIVNNIEIKQVTSIRYLEIHIYDNLNWKGHVHYVSTKIKRSIGMISKIIRNYATPKHRIEINRKATRVGTFEVCVSTHVSLCRFWPVNCLFWPIGTVNWPFRHYSGQLIA